MKLSTFKKWTKKFPELEYVMRRLTNLDNDQSDVAKAITAFNICGEYSKWDSNFGSPEAEIVYDPENGFETVTYSHCQICMDAICFIIMNIVEYHVYNVWDSESWIEYEKIEIKIITTP